MLSVDEARARILEVFHPLDEVDVGLEDALGMALARDVAAPHSLQPFDNSSMDGFAVRSVDVEGASPAAPVALGVVGEARAGSPAPPLERRAGAVRIMTGAPIPDGADAVIPVEDVSEAGGAIVVERPVSRGAYVRRAAEDVAAGDVVLHPGSVLHPGEIALLAALGVANVPVHRRPRVALLVTGDEFAAPGAPLTPGKIYDSNSVALRTLTTEAGGIVATSAHLSDDLDETVAAAATAASESDLIVSSGGVSMGRHDVVKSAIEKLGEIAFWRVAMQPGKPVVAGRVGETPFLGLPGNPVSVHIGFEQFVRPALRKMLGCRLLLRPRVVATLTSAVAGLPGRARFVRVRLERQGQAWVATPTGPQGSHVQSSLVACNGVVRIEADGGELSPGSLVEVEVWRLPGV